MIEKIEQNQTNKCCFICGLPYTEKHHVFYGQNRKKSEKYKMYVYLCAEHHRGTNGVHGKYGNELNIALKKHFQMYFEKLYQNKDFLKTFGRNYK